MKRGLSAVYGFIVVYLLIMAGLSAISNVSSSQASLNQSVDRARQLDSTRSSEHLLVLHGNGSIEVNNDGSVLSSLQAIVSRSSRGTSISSVGYQLPIGGNISLPLPPGATDEGVLTAYGNLFWASESDSVQGACANGTLSLTVLVSPNGSGSASPAGVSLVCEGQSIILSASAAEGYAFASWSGAGNGSYTGPGNPVSIQPGGDVSETADFVPALTVVSISPGSDGASSSGSARQSVVVVAGPPQEVGLAAVGVPAGVSVSFSPPSFNVTRGGVSSRMSVSFSGTDYGLFPIEVLAIGADGERANSTYLLQTTPPNGNIILAGHNLSPSGIGFPREHKAAYWKGTYFAAFVERTKSGTSDTYLPVYYDGGWVSGTEGSMGSAPYFGYDFDLSQSSNQLLKAAVSYNGPELCYNLGTIGGASIAWQYNGVGCEGPQTPTEYTVVSFASGLVDREGNWWAAVETVDPQGLFHFEVLTATNGGWGDVYVSPSFAQYVHPVPELTELQNGAVVVAYTMFTSSSSCYAGDYLVWTSDGGYSWSQPSGPFEVSGSSLCYNNSSVSSLGDSVYGGGVDAQDDLAFWSFNFDTSASYSSTLVKDVAYAGLGSTGGVLMLAYTTTQACNGQDSLHVMWSYDAGLVWNDSGVIGCTHDFVLVPSSFQTFQVLIESDYAFGGELSPECFLYTV